MDNNIWIPPGVLHSLTNKVYRHVSRRNAQDFTDGEAMTEADAIKATTTIVASIDVPPERAIDQSQQEGTAPPTTLPSFPSLAALNLTPFQQGTYGDFQRNTQTRSRSIDYSNMHRGHYEGVLQPPPDVFAGNIRQRAASIMIGSLQRGHVSIEPPKLRGVVSREVSPTMWEGPSIQERKIAAEDAPVSCRSPTSRVTSTRPSVDHQQDIVHGDRNGSILRKASIFIANAVEKVLPSGRKSSIWHTYERAKVRQQLLQRSKVFMFVFQYTVYFLVLAFVYLILVGRPVWGGTIWYIYVLFQNDLTLPAGSAIFVGLAAFYVFGPLLVMFEHPPPVHFMPHPAIRFDLEDARDQGARLCALLIPCYKSEKLLPATLTAAMAVFPAENIFVINNANTPVPPDNTGAVCTKYGVNHVWCPVGSKLVAQYVGCHVAKAFPYVLMIDDDCALPPDFPVHISRLNMHVKVLGYTIKSTGPNSSAGSWCQQAQDLEYKLSGIQRQFAGSLGSATFPHGAISLWDRAFLAETFMRHPGFSVSEDWFFGHVARVLGSRIKMCSSVFVETETPSSLFFAPRSESRGGFGEMTVFKQRFSRWNFFFVNGMYWNMQYILFSWRLGFFNEIGAKIFVFQEVYEALLYLLTPIVFPVSFIVRPFFTLWLLLGTAGMYLINTILFNEIHLRRRNEQINRWVVIFYYTGFKLCLVAVNCLSTWWSIWKYARYFAQRHPKVVEDTRSVGVVLRIEEERESGSEKPDLTYETRSSTSDDKKNTIRSSLADDRVSWKTKRVSSVDFTPGRRLTVTPMKVEVVPELDLDSGNHFPADDADGIVVGRAAIPQLPIILEAMDERVTDPDLLTSVPAATVAASAITITTTMKPQDITTAHPVRTRKVRWSSKSNNSGRTNLGSDLIDRHGVVRTTSQRFGITTEDWLRLE